MAYIYLLKSNIEGENLYKIGLTTNIKKRTNQLQTANPNLILETSFQTKHDYKLETYLHNHFKNRKVKGEWFKLSEEDIKKFNSYCEKLEKALDVLKNENPFY